MASHHHHYHHHNQNTHSSSASAAVCCSGCGCGCGCAAPLQSPPTEPLLQALAAYLLQQQVQPPPPQPHLYSHCLKPQTHAHHQYQHQHQHQHQQKHRFHREDPQHAHSSLVAALARRIDSLEASLRHLSSSPSPPSPSSSSSASSSSSSSSGLCYRPSYSLRDAAARTIQTHFRAFLVRRSRALRQLKDLAFIKSTLNALKSSVSDQTHLDSSALKHKAMDLLLQLDSIQGGDPMIRDGKRSISRELVRFLELVDGVSVKRRELPAKVVKNMRLAQNGRKSRVLVEKLREPSKQIRGFSRVCENDDEDVELEGFHHASDDEENPGVVVNRTHGTLVKRSRLQAKVKKTVSFAENGDLCRVLTSTYEPISSGDVAGIDDERELAENLCRELEETTAVSRGSEDDEEAPQSSDGERNRRRNLRSGSNYEIRGHYQGPKENFVFSAPLPVKMEESSADSINNKRIALKMRQEGAINPV
ncbi:BAG family molecular chaperone regulator 8, chloroplastic [Malania oleifera]|uniref:BAG family molecular chaperone regulator 8, chloroplastic n=1 Tax=Malania oleifera TaxID=397392 RepID=UPI0025AEBFD4|nr:BAG family molecular chaperone regulator 8, chloroplastic [Malania oleifera]